jgi:hypothetical protein
MLQIEKIKLTQLERCYATGYTAVDNEARIMLATEGQGACYQFRGPDFKQSTVWKGPGGTMSIIPIPGKNGDFLAVQNFFPTFQAEHSIIVWGSPKADGKWEITTLINLPYIHRFDIFNVGGINYFLGSTLCTSKKDKEDWSNPGKILVGVLPDSPDGEMKLAPIKEGLVRNHGYCHTVWDGRETGLISCDQGVFRVTPPQHAQDEWRVALILDRPISDIAACDIDGDGEAELVTIEPFHGRRIAVNKKINGQYQIIWEYDKPVDFGHVVWGGKLRGIPTFICGYRKEAAELFYIQCESKSPLKLKTTVIEAGGGPSNISVLHQKDRDIIITANRMVGEGVVYIVSEIK